jgi:flagellar biogenesis protein FliO
MACTARFLVLLLFLASIPAYAASVMYDVDQSNLMVRINFDKGYSNVTTLKLDSSYVVSFETVEEIDFKQSFWDMPVTSIYTTTDGTRKRLIAEFDTGVIVPEVISQEGLLKITFPFPKGTIENPVVGKKAYARMIWGLLIILAIMMIVFWLLKSFFKKQVNTDIPGTGRLLGKADLDIRKSLYFYEIDETIYIIGVTDTSMTLIDKISNEDEVGRIKNGLNKKNDFATYMNFFKKSPSIKDEVEISRGTINERLESLRKR